MNAPPIQPFQQRRQLRSRQTHHAVFDLWPAEDAVIQPLGKQAQTRTIPEDQLDPVRTLGPEHRPPRRTGRPSWSRAPALPVPRHPCGSLQAWLPPSPGPRPSGRSRAGLQRTQHRHQSPCVRAAADPDRHAVDLNLDRSGTRLRLTRQDLALAASSRCRRGNIHHRWHKLQSIRLRRPNLRFSQLTSPAKQLLWRQSMPSRHTRNRVATRHDLRDNPSLVFITISFIRR